MMEGQENKKHYTAVDIEKYHKGQLTPAEMHALEKAALDDPFLAEAMEGYAHLHQPVEADLAELRARLRERVESKGCAPLVPIPGSEKSGRSPWWRAAAAAILLGALGWGIYQWGFSEGQTPIAKKTEEKNSDIRKFENLGDSGKPEKNSEIGKLGNLGDSGNAGSNSEIRKLGNLGDSSKIGKEPASSKGTTIEAKEKTDIASDNSERRGQQPQPVSGAAAPPAPLASEEVAAQKELKEAEAKKLEDNKSIAARALSRKTSAAEPPATAADRDSVAPYLYEVASRNAQSNRQDFVQRNQQRNYHIFRGKVLDADKQPLPFANITNISDQVGTYADANGNFVLISEDSTMNVQVRSIGFLNNTVTLKPKETGNLINLSEDQSLRTRVLDTTYRVLNLARLNNLKHEEPEPIDGWQKYDTYVANNLQIPDDLRPKLPPAPTVELSFEVDKMGQPVNIRVIRSLCSECDAEAIRLIRDGPRWKPTRKGRKTRVTLSF